MRFVVALCLLASPAAAEGGLNTACSGWAVDRLTLSTVAEKNREMIAALDAVDYRNPTKPLADAMAENLKLVTSAMDDAMRATGEIQSAICP